MKKSGLILGNEPNYINPNVINTLNSRLHPLGELPIYNKKNEPNSWQEEIIASERYIEILNDYASVRNGDKIIIPPYFMMELSSLVIQIMNKESDHFEYLTKLAEKLVREEFSLDESEVLFDLEMISMTSMDMPEDMDNEKKFEDIKEEYDKCEFTDELVKRRTINALIQGAAMKSLYIYYLAINELEEKMPGIGTIYKKAISSNDLIYYMFDDNDICNSQGDQTQGYVRIRYENGKPIIEAKATNFPVLMHETIKGVVELLATFGLPKDRNVAEKVIELSDYVQAELWDIRLGSVFWGKLHGLIDIDDYDIKKHILISIFSLPADEFNVFFSQVLDENKKAQECINYIAKDVRNRIINYQLDKE